jgi:hypothetical protein
MVAVKSKIIPASVVGKEIDLYGCAFHHLSPPFDEVIPVYALTVRWGKSKGDTEEVMPYSGCSFTDPILKEAAKRYNKYLDNEHRLQ